MAEGGLCYLPQMFVSIATTHRPATDLGFLLVKHPERLYEVELSFGKATIFYPEASESRCEAAMVVDVDPVGLVRGKGESDGFLDQYVNDRPYAATSFLSVALNRCFRTAMTGVSKDRPDLAGIQIPLEIRVPAIPARGGEPLLRSLFEPLGWQVALDPVPGPDGASRYFDMRLAGHQRVSDALAHLFVLMPVLDDDKHYWIGEDEVEKLLAKGGDWLTSHPAKEVIVQRYLRNRRSLTRIALARLAPETLDEETVGAERPAPEDVLERPIRLNDLRMEAVRDALLESGATSVLDLGCGEGNLLSTLKRERQLTSIVGLDASVMGLRRAAQRLGLEKESGVAADRIRLLHGALTYRDDRLKGFDAAALVEVIEHLDPDRLPALAEAVFGHARPRCVIVTTPNVEHNVLFPGMSPGSMRHPDHRFEWTRAEFGDWITSIETTYGYAATRSGIGEPHDAFGPPTQMAVFVLGAT